MFKNLKIFIVNVYSFLSLAFLAPKRAENGATPGRAARGRTKKGRFWLQGSEVVRVLDRSVRAGFQDLVDHAVGVVL